MSAGWSVCLCEMLVVQGVQRWNRVTPTVRTHMCDPVFEKCTINKKMPTGVRLVGWLELNVPFQHKYGYIRDESVSGIVIQFVKIPAAPISSTGLLAKLTE